MQQNIRHEDFSQLKSVPTDDIISCRITFRLNHMHDQGSPPRSVCGYSPCVWACLYSLHQRSEAGREFTLCRRRQRIDRTSTQNDVRCVSQWRHSRKGELHFGSLAPFWWVNKLAEQTWFIYLFRWYLRNPLVKMKTNLAPNQLEPWAWRILTLHCYKHLFHERETASRVAFPLFC